MECDIELLHSATDQSYVHIGDYGLRQTDFGDQLLLQMSTDYIILLYYQLSSCHLDKHQT